MLSGKDKTGMAEAYFTSEVYPLISDIRAYVHTLSKDPLLADDVTEDIMLMAWHDIYAVHGKRNIKSYLLKCAKNRIYYYYRKEARRACATHSLEALKPPSQSVIDALVILIKQENIKEAAAAIQRLAPLERRIILMYYVYGKSLKEISKATKVRYNTVSTLKRRALCKLASELNAD